MAVDLCISTTDVFAAAMQTATVLGIRLTLSAYHIVV